MPRRCRTGRLLTKCGARPEVREPLTHSVQPAPRRDFGAGYAAHPFAFCHGGNGRGPCGDGRGRCLACAGSDGPCFSNGGIAYRLTSSRAADYTIRVDNDAQHPDLIVRITDDPAAADLVLLADAEGLAGCAAGTPRTIRLDPRAAEPDVTIALTGAETGGLRVYAPGFRAEEAAALFAAMRKTPRKRLVSR